MKKNKRKRGHDEHTDQGRPQFHPGSTTQGGSNYGQGSSQLGSRSNRQGSELNKGANYGNENTDYGT